METYTEKDMLTAVKITQGLVDLVKVKNEKIEKLRQDITDLIALRKIGEEAYIEMDYDKVGVSRIVIAMPKLKSAGVKIRPEGLIITTEYDLAYIRSIR